MQNSDYVRAVDRGHPARAPAFLRVPPTENRRAKNYGRIAARAGAGLLPEGHRRPVPHEPGPAWPSLGIDDLLLTQLRKKRNGHLQLCLRKRVHERLKAVAVGGHALIVASRPTIRFQPEHYSFHEESGSMPAVPAGDHHMRDGSESQRGVAGGMGYPNPKAVTPPGVRGIGDGTFVLCSVPS